MACDRSCTCLYTVLAAWFILSSVKASTQVDVSGLIGNEVQLPCQIDTKTCGTLHSIKWYRGSSRIYVFSDAIKFHKPEGDYASRALLVYNPNDTTSYLKVKNLDISDEAVYKCEITYLDVIESCLVVQFINLTTLVEPEAIKVFYLDQEVANNTSVGPFDEGSQLSLTCDVSPGKPTPTLYWFKDEGKPIGDYVPRVGSKELSGAVNRIGITVTRNDLGATYVCRSFVQGLNHSMSVHVGIEVNVKPIKMELKGQSMPVRQNSTVTLFCHVYQAKPAANITWFNGSIPLNKKDVEIEDEPKPWPNGTIDTKSRLTFIATRYENLRMFRCRAYNPVMTPDDFPRFEKEIQIQVHYPPIITLTPEDVTVNETGTAFLSCDYDANPKLITAPVWYFNDRRIVENITQYVFFGNQLHLKRVDRTSMGSYYCSLENEVGVSNSSKALVNVLYPPTVYVEADSPTTINETDRTDISLWCKVVMGNPRELNEVRWYFNGRFMEYHYNTSNLVLKEAKRLHHGNYSCAGKTIAGMGPVSPNQEIKIQYVPGRPNLTYSIVNGNKEYQSEVVVKGSTIWLKCEVENLGRPEATQYHWYSGNSEMFGQAEGNRYKIATVGSKDMRNYSCNAANAAGHGENASISIDVHAPPSIINLESYVNASISDTIKEIVCDIECYPECDVTWKKNGTIISNSSKEYEILNTRINPDQSKNDFSRINSKLRLIATEFPDGRFTPNRDDAQYSCESTGNDVGPGVYATIDFRVHYPPVNTTIKRKDERIREGNIPPRVMCVSYARPSPTFRWYNPFTKDNISHEAVLNFQRPLQRSDYVFTCEASNSYGVDTANLTFEFEYKPTCVISKVEDDDKTTLLCKVDANPSNVDYTWIRITKDDGNITLDSKTEEFPLEISSVDELYACIANNSVGPSDTCLLSVPASTDWIILRLVKGHQHVTYLIVSIATILIVIVICVFIIFACRKRRRNEKYNNRIDLPSRQNSDGQNADGTTPAPMMPKWPLKPGVLVHVNNNHSLNARRVQSNQNVNSTLTNNQNHNQYFTATEKRPKRGEILKNIANESQRSRTQRIKQMFFAEQLKYKTDTMPGVFHGKSGVVTFKKFDNTVVPANPRKRKKPGAGSNDLGSKNKNSFHSANDALLQPDGDKAFYENLPFHGMQNPPNKQPPAPESTTRPPSAQSQYDGSSGYGSTRSRMTTTGVERTETETDGKFNSLRPKRVRPNWPQFRSLRTPKKNKIPMLPIKESSPETKVGKEVEEPSPKILPKPVPAPRKVIGFNFNKPSAKHTYQNVPIPITPNTASQPQVVNENFKSKQASTHLTNSSPMEYFRLTPTNNMRSYNGSITTNLSLKKAKITPNNALSPTLPRGGPPTVPRHHNSSYPSTHQLNNGLVYADLTVSRHKKKHHRHTPISNTQTYPYHTEYAPFRPEFSDLSYADVDYRSYGPINYKAASIYATQKRNESETESEDYLL